MTFQALIFDVDGTLAETEEAIGGLSTKRSVISALDWHWSRPVYADLLKMTGGKERIRDYVSQYRPEDAERVRDIVGQIHGEKTARYVRNMGGGGVRLRPGVGTADPGGFSAGVRLAIATTTSLPNVRSCWTRRLAPGLRACSR